MESGKIKSVYDKNLKDLLFELTKATNNVRETRIKSELNLL